jgi:quercetin dioxygenase-like cupin family protein
VHVTRLADAKTYEAPKHFGMSAFRLQGYDASPTQSFSVGLSHFLPGGGAEMSASPLERVYVVLSGEVTVRTSEGATVLKAMDSCHLASGEARSVVNATNLPASMLVIMPYPEGARK